MKCPCQKCERRTITCHGVCDEYKQWRLWLDGVNAEKAREQNALKDLPNACKKAWWKRLKQSI